MGKYDTAMLALALIGLALNILLGLLPENWRAVHRKAVIAGHLLGFLLLGVGAYVLLLVAIPPEWGSSLGPKISIVIGAILLVGGIIWQFASSSGAQTTAPKFENNSVTGMTIQGNSQGDPAAEFSATGSHNQAAPPVGLDINAVGGPGQSVTGLRIIQNGPGTGLKVTVGGSGPATGVRVNVESKP